MCNVSLNSLCRTDLLHYPKEKGMAKKKRKTNSVKKKKQEETSSSSLSRNIKRSVK